MLSFLDCSAFFNSSFRLYSYTQVLWLLWLLDLRLLAVFYNLILWYRWFILLRGFFYFFFLNNLTFYLRRQKSLVPTLVHALLLFDLLSFILTLPLLLWDYIIRLNFSSLSFIELLIRLVDLFLYLTLHISTSLLHLLLLLLLVFNKLLDLFHPTGWASFAFGPSNYILG